MFLRPVTSVEICQIAQKLNNKDSSNIIEIPTSLIKQAVPEVQGILCYVVNNSFRFGVFPDQLKTALIKPLFKRGDPEYMDNYRPISLLPGFLKIFEMAMNNSLLNFFRVFKLITDSQHGFLSGKSTQTAIFDFT